MGNQSALPSIRPAADLRNKFTEVMDEIYNSDSPIFLTKKGYCDTVIMSADTFTKYELSISSQREVYFRDLETKGGIKCSFCNKKQQDAEKIIAGCNGTYICDECIGLCAEILEEDIEDEDVEEVNKPKPYTITFASIYPMYIQKAEKKGRTQDEVDDIIFWLTGYDKDSLKKQIDDKVDLETFYKQTPAFNPNASLIKGVVCGCRVEDIEDKVMQKIRYLDKLIDELAKGKAMDKILRK